MTLPSRTKRPITPWILTTSLTPTFDRCGKLLGLLSVVTASLLVARTATADGWQDFSHHAQGVARKVNANDVRLVSVESVSNCGESAEDCREELGKLRADTLDSINLDIHVTGVAGNDYPCECRLEGEEFQARQFATTTMTWKAAGYCHKPLYFEQWNFERYGHSFHPVADPFISAAHFFASVPALPYKMGVELPWECIYPLGYYRPGDCAPWTVPAPPISARGAAVEAAAATGIIFILP
jgi:hypothetical protein